MKPLIAALLMMALPARVVAGGRRPFLFAYDAPSIAGGDVELETWLDFMSKRAPLNDEWRWWLGPRWAPVDGFEVTALTVLTQDLVKPPDMPSTVQLWAEVIELRWRVHTFESIGSITLELDGRIAIANDLPFQASPSVAWNKRAGRFGFAAQVGYAAGFAGPADNDHYHWITWRAGASIDAVRGEVAPILQFGVEGFGEAPLVGKNDLTDDTRATVNIGPTISVARGRLWLTLGALFGVTEASPAAYVRGILGVSL